MFLTHLLHPLHGKLLCAGLVLGRHVRVRPAEELVPMAQQLTVVGTSDATQSIAAGTAVSVTIHEYLDTKIRFHFTDFRILSDDYDTCFNDGVGPHQCDFSTNSP